jgi:hypothetical protein
VVLQTAPPLRVVLLSVVLCRMQMNDLQRLHQKDHYRSSI